MNHRQGFRKPLEEPAYLKSHRSGLLREKIRSAYRRLEYCTLCPRRCGANRLSGEKGVCRTGKRAEVSSYQPHFGEEAPLVGVHGSGTIFFTHCNLFCIFCQNYEISHQGIGNPVSGRQLAEMMIRLQERGCHNINLVTPSHVAPQILLAIEIASKMGLYVPLIYNTSGYDSIETLRLLDGIIDIYMPDFKFWDSKVSEKACKAGDYSQVVRQALIEMHRQVGDLVVDASGIAVRGLLVRHLVLPDGLAGTRSVMNFIAENISPNTYVNIMAQYRPCWRADEIQALSRPVSRKECEEAMKAARAEGIVRLDTQR